MHVASLSPLSVGGFAWSAPDPCYTVVLKATFTLERDGPLNLHLQQSPVCDEQPGASPEELFYPSDFAPRKVGVDVSLVGHARSREPASVVPFRIALGELEASPCAVAEVPTRSVPLWRPHVRPDPDSSKILQLAPRPTATRSWRHHLIASHFDFTAFNAAPPELRLDEMPLDAVLRLDNLLTSSPKREVLIGDTQPYIFYVRDARARDEVDLLFPACDSVWVDSDRERLTLTWRGEARPGRAEENPFLAVVLGTRRVPPDWADVRRRLAHARWHEAIEPPSAAWAAEPLRWSSPGWGSGPPPAPSSQAQMIARGPEDWTARGYDGPPTPKRSASPSWSGEAPPPTPRSPDDAVDSFTDTPRQEHTPRTPRSLDDDDAPDTPRTFAEIERTERIDPVEITDRVSSLYEQEHTEPLPPVESDSGPPTRRNLDQAELSGYLSDLDAPSRPTMPLRLDPDEEPRRRPTEPCPPGDDEAGPASGATPT